MQPYNPAWETAHIERHQQHRQIFGVVGNALNALLTSHCGGIDPEGTPISVETHLISDYELMCHDSSKLSDAERPHYARKWHGPADDEEGWKAAFLHHIQANPHHWQHWVEDGAANPIPEPWCAAMVADWMTTSYQLTGSLDMTAHLNKHLFGTEPTIALHPDTHDYVFFLLEMLGYRRSLDDPTMIELRYPQVVQLIFGLLKLSDCWYEHDA